MKWRAPFIGISALLLGAAVYSVADARPAAGSSTWPLSLITNPCTWVGLQGAGSGPARVVCVARSGRLATINVPTPYLSDRTPELSLVNIPTFFNLEWDGDSQGASDSAPLTITNPPGSGATDQLTNVTVQLRLWAVDASGSSNEERLVSENVAIERLGRLTLVPASAIGKDGGPFNAEASFACNAVADPSGNALLTIRNEEGGYNADGSEGLATCEKMAGDLAPLEESFDYKLAGPHFADETFRYMGPWLPLSVSRFLAFSPYASIYGAGTDRGSPAFQISATTRFRLEARLIFDTHNEWGVSDTVEVCSRFKTPPYDYIDLSNWPEIFCRTEEIWGWVYFCSPFGGDCPYGHPDDWWMPVSEALEVQVIRRPDGTYGRTYDFVSVQSQALLAAP